MAASFRCKNFALVFLFLCAIAITQCISSNSCLGQSPRSPAAASKEAGNKPKLEGDVEFAKRFWNYLLSNNYKHWSPPPGKPAGFFKSNSNWPSRQKTQYSHTFLSKIYANRVAASETGDPPMGSVLILENYRKDQSLESISVMYRSPGFNPDGNNWFWAQYAPDGSLIRVEPIETEDAKSEPTKTYARAVIKKPLVGKAKSCIQCHDNSQRDMAFFNDRVASKIRLAGAEEIQRSKENAKKRAK